MTKRTNPSPARKSGRRSDGLGPMGTLPMFDTTTTDDGLVVAAGRFRCGLCNTMGVDEAGELCQSCADHVLTEKCRYRRPADAAATATRAPRKPRPRKTTPKTPAGKASTAAGKSSAAGASTGRVAG